MRIKITAVLCLLIALVALTACTLSAPVETPTDITETASSAVEAMATAAQTTLPETTVPPTAPPVTTTLPVTAALPATTAKAAEKTTAQSTTEKRNESSLPTLFSSVLSNETVSETVVKYGVVMHTYETIYYQYLTDGSRKIIDERTTYTYNYSDYHADYEDLLPAARSNRETYRDFINRVLRIINGYRAEGGVAPLKLKEDFTVMSCVRAEEIAFSGKFSHVRPNLKMGTHIFKEIGYDKGSVGENIGKGYPTPEAVCEAWKNSKTHYEVLMNPEFTQTGIGVSAGPGPDCGELFWTQHFYGE